MEFIFLRREIIISACLPRNNNVERNSHGAARGTRGDMRNKLSSAEKGGVWRATVSLSAAACTRAVKSGEKAYG